MSVAMMRAGATTVGAPRGPRCAMVRRVAVPGTRAIGAGHMRVSIGAISATASASRLADVVVDVVPEEVTASA